MLSQKIRRILAELSYEELFDAVLCKEREKYADAPESVRAAVCQAWLAGNDDMGLIDLEVLDNIEQRLGIDGMRWDRQIPRLFVDMDGTIAEFKPCRTMETLYEKGYFAALQPLDNVVDAIRIHAEEPHFDVYILSAYLADSPYALAEKEAWLNQYLPEIDPGHRIFCPCGQDKSLHIPGGVKETDCLLDDYTQNLRQWEKAGGRGIKLRNGINGTKGTWQGAQVYANQECENLAMEMELLMVRNHDNVNMQKGRQGLRR